MHLRYTAETVASTTPVASVEIIGRVCAKSIPAICTNALALLLCLGNLLLQLRGARIDELEL